MVASGIINNDQGQSLLEFLFMLPVMIGLFVLMMKINSAIQTSIVDQQYARAQATFLAFNSPVYPLLRLQQSQLNEKNYNQVQIGVADNLIGSGGDDSQHPVASTQLIVRTPAQASQGSDDPQVEPPTRAKVRIRNTVSLCTQANVIGGQPILPLASGGAGGEGLVAAGPYNPALETGKIDYCRGLN